MMARMGEGMQIYLVKPGGQREGPFSLEEINRDLAARKYRDTDYWAWYEGLTDWVPLHSIPGIHGNGGAQGGTAAEEKAPAAPEELPASTLEKRRKLAGSLFLAVLCDADRDLRQAAAEALGRLGEQRAQSALARAARDLDAAVRAAAEHALQLLGASQAGS